MFMFWNLFQLQATRYNVVHHCSIHRTFVTNTDTLRFLFPMLLTHVLQPESLQWILHCPGEIIEFLRCIAASISVLQCFSNDFLVTRNPQHFYIYTGFPDWLDLRTQPLGFNGVCWWWFPTPHLDRLFVSICSLFCTLDCWKEREWHQRSWLGTHWRPQQDPSEKSCATDMVIFGFGQWFHPFYPC